MKKFLLGTVGLMALGIAAPAWAADLAARPYTKAPPAPVVAVYDWTGFYIGANGGWGSNRNCWDFVDAFGVATRDFCRRADGGLAGGQIGYRWQTGTWVWGLEAQGDWADLKSDTVSALDPRFIAQSRIDAIGLFTGQIGWATNWAASSVLFYVKGGAAVIGDRFRFLDRATGTVLATTGDDTRWGGVVGAGFEWGFSPGWSVGVEYDHLFMGDNNRTFVSNGVNPVLAGPAGAVFATDRIRNDIDMVTVRVNYRFGAWGGPPVAARY